MELPPAYKCDDQTQIIIVPGTKGPNDFILKTFFPTKLAHAHTLEYIGQALRLKGEVEERNYPINDGYQGKIYLFRFIVDCIFNTNVSVRELCRIYKIPTRINGNGQQED